MVYIAISRSKPLQHFWDTRRPLEEFMCIIQVNCGGIQWKSWKISIQKAEKGGIRQINRIILLIEEILALMNSQVLLGFKEVRTMTINMT